MPQARYSLRTKWIIALVVAGVLPLACFALFATKLQRDGLSDVERSLELAVLLQVSEVVDRPLHESKEITHNVGALLTSPDVGDETKLSLVKDLVGRASLIRYVGIFDAQGVFIDSVVRDGVTDAPKTLPTITYSPFEMVGGAWITGGQDSAKVGTHYLESIVINGQPRAWVMGVIDDTVLSRKVGEISKNHMQRNDSIFITDSKKAVLFSQAQDLAPGTDLSTKDVFRSIVAPPTAAFESFGATAEYTDEKKIAMVGSIRAMPAYGWFIAVRRPEAEAYAALVTTRLWFIAVGAVVSIIAAIGGIFLGARATAPVLKLVTLTEAFAKREFTKRVEVATGDELQTLNESMVTMAGALQASEEEILRRANVESNLSRFLPETVAREIANGSHSLSLGGQRREISVIFADVVSFTSFAEGSKPEAVVSFLNELFGVMTEVVFRHGGTVDKFMGDCIVALFGAPDDQPDHADRALAAAEDLHRFVEANSPLWTERYGFSVRLAIGLNSGEAIVGNLGSDQRMEYTAIGDTVNVAARLETLAAPGQTLTTQETKSRASEAFTFQSHGVHPIRGKSREVEVFEPTS